MQHATLHGLLNRDQKASPDKEFVQGLFQTIKSTTIEHNKGFFLTIQGLFGTEDASSVAYFLMAVTRLDICSSSELEFAYLLLIGVVR